MEREDGLFRAALPACWMQGRTAYGGASAALALAAALAAEPDLPPLRSAQIAFVGPLGGALEIRPTLLRRGRSASFVRVDVASDGALGLAATFLFAAERESQIAHQPEPIVPSPHGMPIEGPADIAFVHNFDHAEAGTVARGEPRIRRWARLKDRSGLSPALELVAIADVLPPPALMLAHRPGPISTTTWQLDLLTPAPSTEDGWWLLSAEADMAERGFSSQAMTVHNADGALIAVAKQSVALFV
ncbi:thioesterase family protein [Sphingomonas parva]|uniref:Thioesterase family protein n=2 Tax=Sphingomonas parva TaxID=2555898 RepID=A0A4Y8ZRM5_9SPHN|nr:thioesterase family protein [Sphingomonas parva]